MSKFIIFFILIFSLTTLALLAFFASPNLQISPSIYHRALLEHLKISGKVKPHVHLSPSPSPSPSPSQSPLPLQAIVPRHRRHHLSPLPVNDGGGGRRGRRRRTKALVAGVVSATCMICVIALFLLFTKLRKQRKEKTKTETETTSSAKNVKSRKKTKVISDPVQKNFYLDSLGTVLETPPICSSKPNSVTCDDRDQNSNPFEEEDDEQCVFGSPIAEEIINLESHSSDDESFHSLCNSNDYSNPRISDASISSDILKPQTSPLSPPPPPPPPPPPYITSPSSTKFKLKTVSLHNKSNVVKSNVLPIPPPPLPPPPPFPKGSPLPPPPPPPCLSPQTGKGGSPLPKLKPLHWDKVRAASNRSMVWDKLRSSSFEFDEEMIESLFSYNRHNSNEELKSKSPSPSKHVLEPKRLQNLTILLKALNVTADQICCALEQGNGLNLQQLEVLIKMEPTKEEEAKLSEYKGDMGSAETFVTTILTIPYAFQRIEALLYRETFEDEVTHLRKTFSVLEEACKELRSSRLFLKLLEAVLKTGNRMNVGTIRGGAKAFKLEALLKLADVKGTDGKTTLLHFVVQEIIRSEGVRVSESIIGKISQKGQQRNDQEREEDYRTMGLELVAGLGTELCNVKKTATIDFDVIASSVSNLSNGMDRLRTLVNEYLLQKDQKPCSFAESMKSFMNYGVKRLKELEDDKRKVLELVKEITEYFHGNMSREDANPLRIFVTVRDFLAMLDVVCRELRRSKVFSHPSPLSPFQ